MSEKIKANLLWFLPTYGDSRYLGDDTTTRQIDLDYLISIAKAAEKAGFLGTLVPTGRATDESYVVASSLFANTKKFKFLVALRPGVITPTFAARIAASMDRLSGGRVLFNLVAGNDDADLKADGVQIIGAEKYAQATEFARIWKDLLDGKEVNFKSKYYDIEGAKLYKQPLQIDGIPLFFGGSSEPALELSAELIDKYLSWAEPPEKVKEKFDNVRQRAKKYGREDKISFGVRLHVIVRETDEEAWEAARKLISRLDDKTIADAKKYLRSYQSEGQKRLNDLYDKANENLEIYPNLWAGVGLIRGGAGTTAVGSVESVLRLLKEYVAIGADTFVLSGYPHLEEAITTGELLLPHFEQPWEKEEPKLRSIVSEYKIHA
ncbi:MAG: LLM class flavin-dependent oxidoreductase [Cardiobacteriaceae bacterium]|nr:LLM class flavin-dependent oxidoreductase [Cardiobacteriaceae bacterium]